MKHLITGAAGFVGSVLTRKLVGKGEDVYIILRESSDTYRIFDILDKVKVNFCDLNNEASVREIVAKINPDYIYHLATYGVYPGQKDEKKIFQNNILGTLSLLSAATSLDGLKMFVNAGSFLEYGSKQLPMKENDLLEPNNPYAVSKSSQTLMCQYFAMQKLLPVISIRLFAVYGPYEGPTRLIPTLIKNCLEGKELLLVSPDVVRDFVYVEDVADLFLKVINFTNLSGNIFNCATGRQTTLMDVAQLIKKITGADVDIKINETVGRPWDTNISIGDMEKCKKMLNWQPSRDLSAGLTKTIDFFRG